MSSIEGLAMELLKEHFETNDPYVDDMPSARHAAIEHRKDCKYCIAYGKYLKNKPVSAPVPHCKSCNEPLGECSCRSYQGSYLKNS